MKKAILILTLAVIAVGVNAQENSGQSSAPGRITTFVQNGFWDNWFIGAGAGANIYFGDHDANAKFLRRITVTPNFQIGKWISPYWGARLKASGGTRIHTFNNDAATMTRNSYVAVEANMMWDLTNYLMKYNSDRFYSFIPYAGMGWAYGWNYDNLPDDLRYANHVNSLTFDVGIINKFRFNDRVALDIEFSAKALRNEFDQRSDNHGYDILGTASASLIFTLGEKGNFSEAILRDQTEIDNMNNQINMLRADNSNLTQRLANIPPCPPAETVVVNEIVKGTEPVNNVVLFNINSTKIDSHQEVNIYNVAKYLRENPELKLRIVGYTDSATGTAAINERLSRERAQNVADIITGKYGISKDRITISWEGMTQPPFDVDAWNRAVILYIEQ